MKNQRIVNNLYTTSRGKLTPLVSEMVRFINLQIYNFLVSGVIRMSYHSLTHSLLRLTSEGCNDLHNERSCTDDHSESIVHP